MKIGVFSDVHGHLAELEKTLRLFNDLQVDERICAGDLVDKGNDSDAVVTMMRDEKIHCVRGNHDFKAQFMWLTHNEPLQSESLLYLEKLPPTLTFEWLGTTVYMCHANLWEDSSIYVYPTRPLVLFEEVANAVDADVIIMGHTHQPMRVQVGDKLILNPGSIYGNREVDARTCGILSLPDRKFDIYDIDSGIKLELWK